jgi:hypothetical protein
MLFAFVKVKEFLLKKFAGALDKAMLRRIAL